MWHSPSIRAGREDTLMRPAGQLPAPRSDPPNEPSSTRPAEPGRHPLAPPSFLAINSSGGNLPWLLVHRHKNCFWKGPWPLVSCFLYLSHWITSRGATVHTCTHTHRDTHSLYLTGCVWWVKNQGRPEFNKHNWLTYRCTFHDFYFHIL